MSDRRSIVGASLVAAALAAFSFAPLALAAGGPNGGAENGGGFSGGGGRNAGGFSGGSGFSGSGFGGGFGGSAFSGTHIAGRNTGGTFARSSTIGGGHLGSSAPAFTSNTGSHVSSTFSTDSRGSLATRPFGTTSSPAWQHSVSNWNNGQFWGNHWRFEQGNFFAYPNYFAFVPLFYNSYGYFYPYSYGYGDPYAFYALYGDGDAGLPPMNLQPANPAPLVQAGPDAQNAAAPNAAPPNPNIDPLNPAATNAAAPNAAAPNAAGAVADGDNADNSAGAEFFAKAEAAFQEGHYRDALRLANHAAVESPRNPKAHELMSLSLFALADYRGAAIEAHAAIALGPIADWATVFGYYGDQARYTTQLRALEKYSHENPKSAEARFLRAYHYLMTGHVDAAKEQLTEAIKLTPNDKLATELLKKYNGNAGAALPPAPVRPAAPTAPQNPAGAKPVNPAPDGFDS